MESPMKFTGFVWGTWYDRQLEDAADANTSISSEETLIARCLDGDEVAYSILYSRYASNIYRLTFGLLQHKQDAEEVLQDSFEYAFRRLDRFDANRASFKTWLYQIAISRSRNKRRRKWLPTVALDQTSDDQLVDRARPQPEERLARDEQQRVVWEALQTLSPRLRETAILRYYAGLTFVEIGQVLAIPPKTAQSRMRLAHKQLKLLLNEESI
jgi:RNA polymerase sigma-70 factor, ECF subfamily